MAKVGTIHWRWGGMQPEGPGTLFACLRIVVPVVHTGCAVLQWETRAAAGAKTKFDQQAEVLTVAKTICRCHGQPCEVPASADLRYMAHMVEASSAGTMLGEIPNESEVQRAPIGHDHVATNDVAD